MNEDCLFEVCDAFGLRSTGVYSGSDKWGPHASVSCPLAPMRHNDPEDFNLSCSVSINDDGPAFAKCFSFNCRYRGSFYEMLRLRAEHDQNPDHLVTFLERLAPTEKDSLEGRLSRSIKRFQEKIDTLRRPSIPVSDADVLPEARLARYSGNIPRYALQRGLTIESCRRWELGYDKGRGRLVFPIRRYDGKLVGLTGRILPSAEKQAEAAGVKVSKYHNYVGLDKTKYLFGEHLLEHKKPIVLCEGQIDVILTFQQLGIHAVAPLGEGFSKTHVKTISAFDPPVVYVFPDNDPPGRMGAEKFVYMLAERVPLKLMLPPEGLDPGDLSEAEMRVALDRAVAIYRKINWSLFDSE